MKPSDLGKVLTTIVGWASHFHTAFDLLGVLGGKAPNADAHAVVKGLYGVFGQGDERAFAVLLGRLETGDREILADFFVWHFKRNTTPERVLTWWYGNAFRAFVTKMGSSEGQVDGKASTTIPNPTSDGSQTVIEHELRTKGINNALIFLKMMIDIIKSEPEREKGFEKLLKHLECFGFPHIPEHNRLLVNKLPKTVSESLESFDSSVNKKLAVMNRKTKKLVAEEKKKAKWFQKTLDSIFG